MIGCVGSGYWNGANGGCDANNVDGTKYSGDHEANEGVDTCDDHGKEGELKCEGQSKRMEFAGANSISERVCAQDLTPTFDLVDIQETQLHPIFNRGLMQIIWCAKYPDVRMCDAANMGGIM